MINIDYLYNPDAVKDRFDKNYFIDKKLGFRVIENGTILSHKFNIPGIGHWGGGGIIDDKAEYVKSSHVNAGIVDYYIPPPDTVQHSSETAIYLGLFFPIWGHAITDHIRRVWFLKSEFFKTEFKNCPIVYIPWLGSPIEKQPSFKRLLEILEVDVNELQPITQPTQFDKIILPDESFLSPGNQMLGFTAEYRETVDRVRDFALKNRTPTSIKKIYHFNGRKSVGEERIAEYFKSNGFEIVSPEKLPLDEQLNILINCECFGSVGASCAHNSLFLRNETETIFIPRAASKFGYFQEIINQVHPLNVNYIDSSISVFSKGVSSTGHCYIVSEQLKRFFGDKFDGYEDEDFKIFLQYVKDSINKGIPFNQNCKNYYSPVLEDFMEQLKSREDLIVAYNMPQNWETFKPPIPEGLGYQTHVDRDGWGNGWKTENQISNPLDKKRDIQAIRINFPNHKVYYSVYYSDEEGWSKEVSNSEQAGTTGKHKSIYGMKIRLDETAAKESDILYRMHTFDDEWTPWAKNGEELLSGGVKLNAIQVKLRPLLSYQTHLHNKGWRDGWHTENQISNPLEQKLDVLAIRLNFPEHKVYYSVYFNETEGWSAEVLAPEMAGTVGVRKPIYGMRIRLDEAGAKEYDILYRMHTFDDTWTPWAKNGENLYSYGVKLNAIQVKLENKTSTD